MDPRQLLSTCHQYARNFLMERPSLWSWKVDYYSLCLIDIGDAKSTLISLQWFSLNDCWWMLIKHCTILIITLMQFSTKSWQIWWIYANIFEWMIRKYKFILSFIFLHIPKWSWPCRQCACYYLRDSIPTNLIDILLFVASRLPIHIATNGSHDSLYLFDTSHYLNVVMLQFPEANICGWCQRKEHG